MSTETKTLNDIDRDMLRVAARSNDAHAAITRLTDDATAAMMAHVDMMRGELARMKAELAEAKALGEQYAAPGESHLADAVAAMRARIDDATTRLMAITPWDDEHSDDTLSAGLDNLASVVADLRWLARPDGGVVAENATLTVENASLKAEVERLRDSLSLTRGDLDAATREIERLKEEIDATADAANMLAVEIGATAPMAAVIGAVATAATKKPRKAKEPVDLGPGPFVIMRNDAHGRRFWGYTDEAWIECGWLTLDGAKAFDIVADAEGFKPNRSKVIGIDEARRLLAADAGGGDAEGGNVAPADEPATCVLCDKVQCGCDSIEPDTVTTDDRVEREPADDAADVETHDADDDSWAR